MRIKVLVVDDTILYRKIIKDVLETIPNVEVVGTVNNGKTALSRIKSLKPDILTLDIEMPLMDGIEVLEEIQAQQLDVECVMISSKTQKGSEATIRALELGAFDFIEKPDESTVQKNMEFIKKALSAIISAYSRRLEFRKKLGNFKAIPTPVKKTESGTDLSINLKDTPAPARKRPFKRTEKSSVIAIGISTGGPNALTKMLPMIPSDIGVPIFLVQHMPPMFSASLAASLDKKCSLKVKEAVNGEVVEPNTVYIAEGGKQMKVASGANFTKIIRISDDPPENNCKPSVDYLFRSIAREYGSKATCVIMTGMGTDGKLGVKVTKASGAISIAQSAETCVVYGMPKVVIDAGLADVIAPLEKIADEIIKTLK